MDYIKLYFAYARVSFLSQLEYRGQYFIRMLSKIIDWSTGFIMILILLNRFHTLGGWSTYEVLFLYALNVLSYSIAGTFCMGPFSNLPQTIQQGNFDSVLTKPVNPLFYYICTNVSAGYTSNYVIAIGVLVVCFFQLHLPVTFIYIVWLIIVLIGATLIQAAGFMIPSCLAFWLINSNSASDLFFWNLREFLQYPLNIYNKKIQVLLTFIFPYAFINFYPAEYFLGKENGLFSPVFQFLTPVVGIVLILIAYLFWTIGINNYKSTGS